MEHIANDAVNSYAEARVFLDARYRNEYGMLSTYDRIGYGRSINPACLVV